MIARDLSDGRSILIRQEDHADLSAQFASQWGNARFARPDPYQSVVAAAAYHDTHYRDIEIELVIDRDHGRPFGHRALPFAPSQLDALRQNIKWLRSHDPYAGLLVSTHHTGLQQNRYGVINSWQNDHGKSPRTRAMRPEVAAMVQELEEDQRAQMRAIGDSEDAVHRNYRLMQVFDLLALYLCCDGYGDDGMKEATLGPVPDAHESSQEPNLHIISKGANVLRFVPYPFQICPLQVAIVGRVLPRLVGHSESECRAEFLRAPRQQFSWTITN